MKPSLDGFLLVDKHKGMTSFDVVREIKRLTGEKKVGHAGTLDPLASGLLIVAVGRKATRQLQRFLKADKEYEVEAKFGYISDTYDADGSCTEGETSAKFSEAYILSIIKKYFLNEIEQTPPKYSALKIKGRRACDIMRKGGNVELKPRKVTIYKFEISDYAWPKVRFRVKCTSGTYIRSLIHDLGQKLGCGAYVEELRRTKIGDFSVKDANL